MKNIFTALTTGTAIAAITILPYPAHAWGGLIQQAVGTTVNVIQENERRNAQTRRLEIQAEERATEEAIQAEVERRLAAERSKQPDTPTSARTTHEQQAKNLGFDLCSADVLDGHAELLQMTGMGQELGCNQNEINAAVRQEQKLDRECGLRGFDGWNGHKCVHF